MEGKGLRVKTSGEVIERGVKQRGTPLPLPHAVTESHMRVRPAITDTSPRAPGEKSQKKEGMPGWDAASLLPTSTFHTHTRFSYPLICVSPHAPVPCAPPHTLTPAQASAPPLPLLTQRLRPNPPAAAPASAVRSVEWSVRGVGKPPLSFTSLPHVSRGLSSPSQEVLRPPSPFP